MRPIVTSFCRKIVRFSRLRVFRRTESTIRVLCRECKKKVDDCENTHQLICTYLFLQTGRKRVCQESTLAKRMRDRLHFGSAEAGQMHQSILKNPRNLKDIDVRFTEIYRRLEYHESIFWWG